jgi:sulfonate transport system substrate-binding protein
MGIAVMGHPAPSRPGRRTSVARGLSSVGLWLALGVGCSREGGVKLPPGAPLPDDFPATTRLELGDPAVERQLLLTGGVGSLPFEVSFHNVSGGPQTIEAFRAGALDGGAVGDTPPIHAAFTGLDVKIVAVQYREKPMYELALAPGAHVGSIAELRGKRIAYSPGQAQGALVLRVLAKAGILRSDVQLVQLVSTEFKDALASRQVDVAPLGSVNLRRYLGEYSGEGASSIPHGVADGYSFFYVRGAVLEDAHQAAALKRYVEARTRAQLWSHLHPEQWVQGYYVADQGLSAEEGRYILESLGEPEYPSDWSEVAARTQQTVDLLAEATGQKRFDATRLFDRRFEAVAAEAANDVLGRTGLLEDGSLDDGLLEGAAR